MPSELDASLRIAAQIALLQSVTPRLRAVSLDMSSNKLSCRFVFDGEPTADEKETGSCVVGEIVSHYWQVIEAVNEEYLACPIPQKVEHLRLLVYQRCEEPWAIWQV